MSVAFQLKDRVALVTGGSRGIGRAISVALAKAGAHVCIGYASNREAADEALAQVQQAGGTGQVVGFDVGDPDAVANAIEALEEEHKTIDILVNNAGISVDQLLMRVRPEDVERTFRTNVQGAVWCAKAVVRRMMKKRRGRIIQISSVVAETGNAGQTVYAASKAALIGLTKSLAREYASRGITVNAVTPGFIETDMTASLPEKVKEQVVTQVPLKRVGTPEDVASAVLYLASDEASYVTGHVLKVNGGMHI